MTSRPFPSESSAPAVKEDGSATVSSDRALIRQALSNWSVGNFQGCLLDLDDIGVGRHTSESILLRARALLRLQRAEDAKKWLSMMESRHTDDDAIATHSMLLGSAYSQLQQFDSAATLFDSVRLVAPHPTIVTETAYYHALSLWQARNYKAARAVLQPAISAAQDIVTARALQLLGFIAISEQNFAESHRHFEAALQSLIVCRARDKHLEATLLHVLSIGQAEVDVRDPARLDRLARDFEWTEALVTEHVQTLRHIGLAYARTNQPHLALDRLIQAASVQNDSPWAIIGFSEAANLCHRLNERVSAGCYLRVCSRIADDLCWDDVTGEARMALLHLATSIARNGDGAKARRYLDLYYGRDRLGARLPALSALNFDSRLQSFERHAEAVVRGALGIPDAVPMLADVVNEWRRLKYRSRSEEARDDIRALTHRSYELGDVVESDASNPSSEVVSDDRTPFAKHTQIRGVPALHGDRTVFGDSQRTKAITVTMQQDRIIRQLVRGRTIAEIAENLTLGQKTVRNHLARVYSLFEVSGQSQLIVAILRDPRLRQSFLAILACLAVASRLGSSQAW
jgi:DNA-binding CsgD family transcriptional regulator/tetratricopeptide (TPR) repeat protein